jgi:hypothetical protein
MIKAEWQTAAIAGKLALHYRGTAVFKEGNMSNAIVELKKIMPVAVMPDPGAELHTQQITIKTNRGDHVVGDKGEMIDSLQTHRTPCFFRSLFPFN